MPPLIEEMGTPMAVDLSSYQARTPDDRVAISMVGNRIGRSLPSDLSEFLCSTGPGEGFIGTSYLILFSAGELIKLNEEYEVQEYAPGLFLFGSNGGGEGFAFDFDDPGVAVVEVPFVGMDRKHAKRVASCFDGFLAHLETSGDSSGERRGLPRSDLKGREIFETTPIILGGSPYDPANKTKLTREQHIEAVRYWNKMIAEMRASQA